MNPILASLLRFVVFVAYAAASVAAGWLVAIAFNFQPHVQPVAGCIAIVAAAVLLIYFTPRKRTEWFLGIND